MVDFFVFKYPQKDILEGVQKSNIPIPFPTLLTSKNQLGYLNRPASQQIAHQHMSSGRSEATTPTW